MSTEDATLSDINLHVGKRLLQLNVKSKGTVLRNIHFFHLLVKQIAVGRIGNGHIFVLYSYQFAFQQLCLRQQRHSQETCRCR